MVKYKNIFLIFGFLFSDFSFASNACNINMDFVLLKFSRFTANQNPYLMFPAIPYSIIDSPNYSFIKDLAKHGDLVKIKALNDFFTKLRNEYNVNLLDAEELFEAMENINLDENVPYRLSDFKETLNLERLIVVLEKTLKRSSKKEINPFLAKNLIEELIKKYKALGYIKPSKNNKDYTYFKDLKGKVKEYDDLEPIIRNEEFEQFEEEVEVAGTILTDSESFPILTNGDYVALIFKTPNGQTKLIYSRRTIIDRENKYFVTHQGLYRKLLEIYEKPVNIIGVIRIHALNSKISEISSYSSNFPNNDNKHIYNSLNFLQKKGLKIDDYTHIYLAGTRRDSHSSSLNKSKNIKKYYHTEKFVSYQSLYKRMYEKFPNLEIPGAVSFDLVLIRSIELEKGVSLLFDYLLLKDYLKEPLEYFLTLYDFSPVMGPEDDFTKYEVYTFIKAIYNEGVSYTVDLSLLTDGAKDYMENLINKTSDNWFSSANKRIK